MKQLSLTACAVAVLCASACTQDSPTSAGSALLPPDAIESFGIELEPERWLEWDTAFGLYNDPSSVNYTMLAHQYAGVLDSRILVRYTLPRTISIVDSLGVGRIDSTHTYVSGQIVFAIDTASSSDPVTEIDLFRTTENWDRESANWTYRVDTAGVQLPWAVPGGSPGAHVSTTMHETTDSIFLPVDPATLAVWADTTDETRGGLIVLNTPDKQLRLSFPALRVSAVSPMNPDTTFEITVQPSRTFIFTPELASSSSEIRVGGTPSWRSILRLRERLDTITVPCPDRPNCTIRLGEASINFGGLVIQPVPTTPGFAPEAPLSVALHAVSPSELVPLERSPLSQAIGVGLQAVPTSSFTTAGGPELVIPATGFVRLMFSPDTTQTLPRSYLALVQASGSATFGFGTFDALPRLRLVVSSTKEVQLP